MDNKLIFDNIYIINLEEHTLRRERTRKTLDKYQLSKLSKTGSYTFFKGINGNKIEKMPGFIFSMGALGCTLSHLSCIKEAYDRGEETILILEDDVIFHRDFNRVWYNLKLPDDWDILYLGASQFDWTDIVIEKDFYRAKYTLGAFAYILKTKLYPDLLRIFEEKKVSTDEILMEQQNVSNCYVLYPNLIIAYLDESLTRPNNKWSLETVGHAFKWNRCLYNFELFTERNIKAFMPHTGRQNFMKKLNHKNLF